VSAVGVLILVAVGLPPLLATLWLVPLFRRAAGALAPVAPLPALVVAVLGPAGEVTLPGVFTGVAFGADALGRAFLFFTAVLWVAAGLFARWYLRDDERRDAYFGFHLATLSGQIALVLAQDLLAFYLGFAMMTFAGYGLVVHAGSGEARRAGRTYMAMAVGGEALLLSALFMLGAAGVGWGVGDVGAAYGAMASPGLVAALVVLGFGVKAGLVPLHLWLPLAHPVAPTPASALLSGAMIKAGLLGWLRFLPLEELAMPGAGAALIVVGVAAAFYGVVVGLAQMEAKTVLAYSSVSQMGFMAVGVGIAAMASPRASAAILAVTHYAAHHAAAKAALFLAVGVAPLALHAAGRFARPARFLFWAAVAAPALALAGAPFTSGSAAKSALKAAGESLPAEVAGIVALLLSLAAVGTTLLLARFIRVLSDDPRPAHHPGQSWLAGAAGFSVLVALGLLARWWLPWVAPVPDGVAEPSPVLGLWDALWPVGIGLVLAGAVWRLGPRFPLRPGRVPPGDLLVPSLRLIRGVQRLAAPLARLRAHPVRWLRRKVEPGARSALVVLVGSEPRLAAGPGLGVLVFLLLAVLTASLLLP
jgi:formate hydrogenlyase subunit 3/multisubunit Na+/H+ antiporter MnhD subunit